MAPREDIKEKVALRKQINKMQIKGEALVRHCSGKSKIDIVDCVFLDAVPVIVCRKALCGTQQHSAQETDLHTFAQVAVVKTQRRVRRCLLITPCHAASGQSRAEWRQRTLDGLLAA